MSMSMSMSMSMQSKELTMVAIPKSRSPVESLCELRTLPLDSNRNFQ
jgi:hypothetical protein